MLSKRLKLKKKLPRNIATEDIRNLHTTKNGTHGDTNPLEEVEEELAEEQGELPRQ